MSMYSQSLTAALQPMQLTLAWQQRLFEAAQRWWEAQSRIAPAGADTAQVGAYGPGPALHEAISPLAVWPEWQRWAVQQWSHTLDFYCEVQTATFDTIAQGWHSASEPLETAAAAVTQSAQPVAAAASAGAGIAAQAAAKLPVPIEGTTTTVPVAVSDVVPPATPSLASREIAAALDNANSGTKADGAVPGSGKGDVGKGTPGPLANTGNGAGTRSRRPSSK
ncbi:hypothetical protein N8I74_17360 [Chitiniphilus purpureus]|uniref:Phasin domain-containing protein n=1 Tax=Chitiniphilus purpureus TaxID=2981137 RepID=A0ABY6DL34_9NEIS|nr:hypothetical protein [Chitiniphilus sp. CD1]UXY15060.1 hypothetical protein N8I74_17360 [Chitiniphilus sp. CD1]